MDLDVYRELKQDADSTVVLLVLDGLGGMPREQDGKTELEAARTPNLDALAARSATGLHEPVGAGITPGSGPAHLALFGYDPIRYQIGRGALSAAGIEFDLSPEDVACRGNFCTIDDDGKVTDRRAGRISTDENRRLVRKLEEIELPDAELFVRTIKEHRLLVVFRGKNLHASVTDTDPQSTGVRPLEARAEDDASKRTAALANEFIEKARETLKTNTPANMILLRGFAEPPEWPSFQDVYGVRSASIAEYPMYRGLARLIGMQALQASEKADEKFATVQQHWQEFDFFYIHVKKTDSYGEDGDFESKVHVIEDVDAALPRLLDAEPDVLLVTGDHSTPWSVEAHSWHPVPVLLSSRFCRPDEVETFGERALLHGALGPRIPATHIMPLAMANAMRLRKFGA